MKILVLTHRLPFTPNRGDRIRVYHLLRLLAADHEVRLVSLVHDKEEAAAVSRMRREGMAVAASPVQRIRNHAVALGSLPTNRPLTHALLDGAGLSRLLEEEAARRPDVVVAYGTGMMRCALEKPLRDVPCVLDMVDVDSEKWEQLSRRSAWPMRWIYRREARTLRAFERLAVRRVHVTTVASEREGELAARVLGGPSPVVVPNGVDLASFAPAGLPAATKRVVFCGVFNYQPNEEAAIWLASLVWPLVRAEEPEAVLQFVGMKPSRAVRRLARAGSVEVTGQVADVRPYLWNGAVAVAPLFVARGVQNKVLEALAAGVPCVVSPAVLQGLPEPVRAGCFEHVNPADFAARLIQLLRMRPDARRAISVRARLHECSWQRQLAPLITLLHEAAGKELPGAAAARAGAR